MIRSTLLILILFASVFWGSPSLFATSLTVHHELRVSLFPESKSLVGHDRITVEPLVQEDVPILLSPRAKIQTLTVDGRPCPIRREGAEVTVDTAVAASSRGDRITIEIQYEAVFDDPVPESPVNTDNPGFGVTGVIMEKGTFLQAGAGWYPQIAKSRNTFAVEIDGPPGTMGVTAGRSLGHETKGERTFSRWEIRQPIEGLALSAAEYRVDERIVGRVTAATYLFPETASQSGPYLDAIVRYLALYDGLFGPYPFEKFAVVENFFPTGYGFPSYTLLGGTVIRLPFIIETSLGHEIAHCWWGNGVQVDMSKGNWCEGLTTYVADYLYKERQSESEARQYRAQMLRNYATLVPPSQDFALDWFVSRTDPVTRTIGYDKGAMVFHMVRRLIGDEPFWDGLKEVYRNKLFKQASWFDFQQAFGRTGNRALDGFFRQWVDRPGAPRLALQTVQRSREGEGWVVEGFVSQERPYFNLQIPIEVRCEGDVKRAARLSVSGERSAFRIICQSRPTAVVADPAFDCFRRLHPSEIPAAVNSLKASRSLLVLVPPGETELLKTAKLLPLSFGIEDFKVTPEKGVGESRLTGSDLLLVGLPENRKLLSNLPPGLAVGDGWFELNGKRYDDPSDVLFAVFGHPWSEGRYVGLFYPLSPKAAAGVERKITHYGKYSYLAFESGDNRDKGIWAVQDSPMTYRWKP